MEDSSWAIWQLLKPDFRVLRWQDLFSVNGRLSVSSRRICDGVGVGAGGGVAEAARIRDSGNLPRHARHRLGYTV